MQSPPSRDRIIELVGSLMYSGRVLNNAHRGDIVEAMVLAALGDEWSLVGLGWHPWDLQRGSGSDRLRIQVKQCAALQLWGRTKRLSLTFGWKPSPPAYFERDNPSETIEAEGYFCDLFVFGLHLVDDPETVDQVDPSQWRFLVVPAQDVPPRTKSMTLNRALKYWTPVGWRRLAEQVATAAVRQLV